MSSAETLTILERQLLLQLGDRLKRLRKDQKIGTVDMAGRAGMTRNTLRAIESGDPSVSLGSYVRVMSLLGVSGELAILAGDTLMPATPGSAGARSRFSAPVIHVEVPSSKTNHQLQDLQSLALHEAAISMLKKNPALIADVYAVLNDWLEKKESRSASLWHEWTKILDQGAWRKVLGRTARAQQLRSASPLVTILPDGVRMKVLQEVRDLKAGITIHADLDKIVASGKNP